jgi:cell division septation protein DedD
VKIDKHISELLYEHDCVIVTDLGGFIANYKPASVNQALNVISPPSKNLAFNSSLRQNDGLLASHISRSEALNYIDACEVIREFVTASNHTMKNGQKVKIEKVGVLFFDKENNLQFQPDQNSNYLVETFGMSAVHSPVIKRQQQFEEDHIKPLYPSSRKPRERRIFGWKVLEVIPAAAVLTFLLLVPPALENFNSNLGTMLPFSRINEYIRDIKGETVTAPVKVVYHSPFETPPVKAPTAANTVTDQTATVNAESAVAKEEPLKETAVTETTDVPVTVKPTVGTTEYNETGKNWHVIGGAFRFRRNAVKYAEQLKSKGVNAEVIGKYKGGMYLISIFKAASFSQAKDTLDEFRTAVSADAWVCKK